MKYGLSNIIILATSRSPLTERRFPMNSIDEKFIRRIVREEIHAYETKLIEFNTAECLLGLASRDEKYKEFIDRTLLNVDTKTNAD
jgi:hypothetical protein